MSTYKEIKGTTVPDLDSDPTNQLGDIFYNSTSNTLKAFNLGSASWTSSGSMSTARAGGGVARSAPQTASLLFGGYVPPGATAVDNTEEYNGSSWTAGGALPGTARNCAGAGTQTAGLFCGGVGQNNKTYEYDGSSWTAGGDMSNIAHSEGQAAGLQTAAFIHNASYTEEYNGSSWTTGGAPADGKIQGGTSGTQTAGISFGGEPISNVAETYNGTSWTAIASMNNNRQNNAGFGTTSSAVSAGGGPPPSGTNVCEIYNGASWSTTATLNTGRSQMQGSGTSNAGMVAGGWVGSPTNATENFTGPAPATVTIDTD